MLQSSEDAPRFLREGPTLLGPGWKVVSSFDEIENEDEEDAYELEEEEMYVTLDLGTTIDSKALQTETQYQLIGLDTPLPFLKIGNQIFQGEVTPLIGDEVILGLIRNHENPHEPSHPPLYSTSHRVSFRGVTLQPRNPQAQTEEQVGDSSNLGAHAARTSRSPTKPSASASKSKSPEKVAQTPSSVVTPTLEVTPTAEGDSEPGPSSRPLITARPLPRSSIDRPASFRPRITISEPGELALLDFSTMAQGLRVALTAEVGKTLSLATNTTMEDGEEMVVLTKTELERAIHGRPERGAGSRGPRGGTHKAKGKTRARAKSARAGGDVIVEDAFVAEKRKAQAGQAPNDHAERDEDGVDEDVEMAGDDDDPPWQEVTEGN